MTALLVHATGPLALVEDLGRPGLAGVGVGRSGAADRGALRQANRVLGNGEGAAAVEVLGGGLEVEVDAGDTSGGAGGAVWCCVTGAPCDVVVDGRTVGSHTVVRVAQGQRLRLGPPRSGLRSYLGVRGGVAVDSVLGSRSHDVLAALGPPALAEGDRLPVGAGDQPAGALPDVGAVPPPRLDDEVLVLRAVRGPRDEHLDDAEALVRTTWTVSDRSNRVGARLAGDALRLTSDDPLPSEGAWRGAVQVPPGGEPVLFLADHPVTGGYPVVAVVVDADVDRAAQAPPGQRLRFRWVETP